MFGRTKVPDSPEARRAAATAHFAAEVKQATNKDYIAATKKQAADRSAASKAKRLDSQPGARIQCPHCGVTGKVRTKEVKQKRGIGGGKATAAVWTVGVSTLATGLSRKEKVTKAHCSNCESRWLL